MTTTFGDVGELKAAVGTHLGYSEWVEVTQERVNRFADATGDHQWTHIDVERAAAGPFGGPIAHGYLTLALTNMLLPQVVEVRGISMGVNYGTNKVRFPAPLAVGSRVRVGAELLSADDVPGGVQTVMGVTVQAEGSEKPVCAVEAVSRYLT